MQPLPTQQTRDLGIRQRRLHVLGGDEILDRPANFGGRDRAAYAAQPVFRALLAAVGSARSRTRITEGDFVPTRRLTRVLIAAAERGAVVRLVLPCCFDMLAALRTGRRTTADGSRGSSASTNTARRRRIRRP
jgi:phosphatidylserine/phosphatidylglycerophosphate/cardiolipin synthase-like enzyme